MRYQDQTLLLVEDNEDDVDLTLSALRKGKVANEIVVARDGQEAVDYLFATGKFSDRDSTCLPRAVLLDLQLPKIKGIEVLKRVRANEKTKMLPVIVLTTSNLDSDRNGSYREGANSYVCKPVDSTQFTEAIQQISRYWLTLNMSPS